MARSRTTSHSAYVLHSRPFRETSVLLDLLTPDQGRISAVYRGARKARVKKSGSARSGPEPFVQYHVSVFGNSDLKSVASIELDAQVALRRMQGVQLFSGLYVNELLYRLLLPGAAQPDVFSAYQDVLLALHNTENYEAHLRNFELRVLTALGYGLSFTLESDGLTEISSSRHYCFTQGKGFTPAATDDAEAVSGTVLQQVAAGHWHEPGVSHALKRINQQAINVLLKGKPIKSREFLQKTLKSR